MHCYQKRLIAYALLMATLTGCANHAATSGAPANNTVRDAGTAPAERAVPVYILPSCKTHAGTRHCQWIEPRGYRQDGDNQPEEVSTPGIQL